MIKKIALLFVSAIFLQSTTLAQESVQWGNTEKPAIRQPIEGMKAYYEPEKVEHDGDTYSFTLYRVGTPSASDEMGRYVINCETREFVSTIKGKTTPPYRLLAGEELYPIGKKLCDWDQRGLFNKLLD